MATEPTLFVVNVDARGLLVHVWVNDITVYTNAGVQATFAEKINPLVVPQANTVAVSLALAPPAPAKDGAPASGEPRFRITVQRGTRGTDPGEAGILLRYGWPPGQAPLAALPAEVFRGTFDGGLDQPQPGWLALPPVQAANAELEGFVLRFADYLRMHDVDRLLALYSFKFRTLASAFDLDAAQMASSFRAQLRRRMDDPAWTVTPVDTSRLRYTPEAGMRLVRITSASGGPPVMTRGAAGDMPFSLTVVREAGALQVFR